MKTLIPILVCAVLVGLSAYYSGLFDSGKQESYPSEQQAQQLRQEEDRINAEMNPPDPKDALPCRWFPQFTNGTKINIIKNGEPATIPCKNVGEALKMGYHLN